MPCPASLTSTGTANCQSKRVHETYSLVTCPILHHDRALRLQKNLNHHDRPTGDRGAYGNRRSTAWILSPHSKNQMLVIRSNHWISIHSAILAGHPSRTHVFLRSLAVLLLLRIVVLAIVVAPCELRRFGATAFFTLSLSLSYSLVTIHLAF